MPLRGIVGMHKVTVQGRSPADTNLVWPVVGNEFVPLVATPRELLAM
ncbi:MAG: hypothetical protein R3E78_15520 [Burkholderiaceae bacterium]